MSESNLITHVRFGAIVNSLIEGQSIPVAKALDRAFRELQTKIEEQQDIINATSTPACCRNQWRFVPENNPLGHINGPLLKRCHRAG